MQTYAQFIDKMVDSLHNEMKDYMPIYILPDKSILYKQYRIKQLRNKNWGVFRTNGDFIDQYFFKTAALLGSEYYDKLEFEKLCHIRIIDSRCWSYYFDMLQLKNTLHSYTDYDQYLIAVNKLERVEHLAKEYKSKLQHMYQSIASIT